MCIVQCALPCTDFMAAPLCSQTIFCLNFTLVTCLINSFTSGGVREGGSGKGAGWRKWKGKRWKGMGVDSGQYAFVCNKNKTMRWMQQKQAERRRQRRVQKRDELPTGCAYYSCYCCYSYCCCCCCAGEANKVPSIMLMDGPAMPPCGADCSHLVKGSSRWLLLVQHPRTPLLSNTPITPSFPLSPLPLPLQLQNSN